MDDTYRQHRVFEKNLKSTPVAYILWFFFGLLGVHRFYAGDTTGGLVRLLLSMTMIGLAITALLWVYDAFRIPGLVQERNDEILELMGLSNSQPENSEERFPIRNETDLRRAEMLEDLRQTGYRKERRDLSDLYR